MREQQKEEEERKRKEDEWNRWQEEKAALDGALSFSPFLSHQYLKPGRPQRSAMVVLEDNTHTMLADGTAVTTLAPSF